MKFLKEEEGGGNLEYKYGIKLKTLLANNFRNVLPEVSKT